MTEAPKHMQRISRIDLYTSLPSRIQYLHSFLEFGPDDVQALIDGQKYIKQIIPAIVNIVYKKLLQYDITARVFTTRDSRDEGPIDEWVSEDSKQIQHRKMFLRWYLTKINSDPSKMEYWEYMDKVGLMHIGKGRRNPLHVDYIFLGACLGYIQESIFEAVLSHPRIELSRKIGMIKAIGKVIWIQNDLFARWHSSDGAEYQDELDVASEYERMAGETEGYVNGKKILGPSGSEDSTSTTSSVTSSSSGKTSLGRPIEDATHLNGPSRCPFSGLSIMDHEEQRANSTRSPKNEKGSGLAGAVGQGNRK